MEVLNEGVSFGDDNNAVLPYSQLKQLYTDYKNKTLNQRYIPTSESSAMERITLGSLQSLGRSFEIIPEGIGIVGGQADIYLGNILQSIPLSLPQAMGKEFKKAGEILIDAANSSLDAKKKEWAQNPSPLTRKDMEDWRLNAVQTGLDYGHQILLGLLTGGTSALATMGVRVGAGTAVEGLEQYKQEHPEDTNLTGFKMPEKAFKELSLNTMKTYTNLWFEDKIGVPAQIRLMKNFKKPITGLLGTAIAGVKGFGAGYAQEFGTEAIQGITDTTFDYWLGRFKTDDELTRAYKDSFTEAIWAGLFGGAASSTGFMVARASSIENAKKILSNVVPSQDLETVATALVDFNISDMQGAIATQLALSTQLRDKHGAIFNAMNVAAKQAMMNSGVAKTMTEDEIAQHSTELATLFADQVLAEANKRNVPIMDVIQDKDIVYDPVKNELRLAPPKQERTTQKIEEKKKAIREKKKQVAEGIKTPEEIALERKKEDTDITDLEEIERDNLDALRMIAFRVADDIDAEFGDTETDFLDLAQVVGDESSLNDNMRMALMMAIPEGYETDDYQIQKKKEIFEEFGKRLAYEPGVYKDYAQIGFDEYMNRVREAWDRSVLRRDLPVFLQESAEIDTESKNYIQKFKDFVDKVFKKKLNKQEKSHGFDVGKTPKKLIDSGIPNNNLSIGYKAIEKASDGRNEDHMLSQETISDVLEALHNPILVAKARLNGNEKNNNRYSVIVNLTNKKGNYVLVGIEADKKSGDNNIINDIRSIHSRKSFEPLIVNAIKDKRLLSVDPNKIKDLFPSNQPDIISGGSRTSHADIIQEILNNVKTYLQEGDYSIKKVDADTAKLDQFREKNKEYNQKAKDYFGITYKLSEGGYILTDGELLDFSGKKFGGPSNTRTMDHREISNAFDDYSVSMEDFINSGNIRFMPEGDKILMSNYPTQKQFDIIRRAVNLSKGYFTIELMSDAQKWGMNRNDLYTEYEPGTSFQKVKRDIDAFYKGEGVRPEMEFYQSAKGMFDANSKVIKLFENADASTLDHELSHFWLDNMWTYATSGAASEAYQAQFQAVKDFLGVKPDQQYLTYNQHEKFASAYEKYIHRGIIPNSIMGNVFDNYERFIRNVYNSINDIQASTKQGKMKAFKLTPEIIKFFDSMIKGGVDTEGLATSMAVEARNEEAQKSDDETMKDAKVVVESMPEREASPEIKPVQTVSETKESRLFNRLKGLARETGAVEYNVAHIEEQREKAKQLWKENPEKAQAILKGTEQADDILRQALYTEQQRLALENGDTNTFLSSLRKQTAEATRMGQELSALRGVAEDITDPAYWIRSAELEALKNLAKKQTKNLENAVGNSPLMELTARLDKDIKALQKDVMGKETDEEKMKALKEGVKSIADKYQGLEQPDTVFNQVDWGNEDYAIDYIENKVKEKLGIALPKETAKAFIQTAHDLDTLSKQRDEFGNPTEAFFVKKDELERMRNSHTPTSRTKILISTIGRGNMLTAPATSVLNAVSNTQNYFVENAVRKVANILEGKTNDNIVDKDLMNKYRGLAWRTFWDTGYDMSFMTSLLDERLYKGESVSHSEGAGWIRGLGRWTEKYVFSRLISSPDIYFKSVLGFTNYVGNEATNIAYKEGLTGDKAKARANQLFMDAIKIEPETDLGKQIRLKAQTDALILTFQQDSKFSEMLLKVRDAINKGTGDIGIGDIMSPFIKTPANILSMSFDTAVGPFASPVNLIGALNDIKRKNYKSARVVQMAKQTTTAALAYIVIGLLASMLIDDDDYIPDYAQLTQKERAIVRARGGSFGSIKVGNKYISTDFFGTFEMPLVTFLNARRTGNIIKGIAGGVGAKFVDAPVLKDILGSSDAIKNMATSKDDIISAIGENVANAAISRLTPNALNAVAKVIDDKDRKINNVMDKILSRIPFARQTLDKKLNVTTGQAQKLGRLNTILLGSRGKDETVNALATELGRLAGVGEVVNITDPTKSGELAKLSDEDKLRIQDIFAIEFAKKASQLVRTSSYSGKSDENKKEALNKVRHDVIDDIKRKYRKEIKKAKK